MIAKTENSCPICQSTLNYVFTATVLRRYDVKYFYCTSCGLTKTEDPYWLGEAYQDAVAGADTGLVQRNLSIASKLSVLLYYGFDPHGRYVDIAGGYGMLVRLMRDIGFDFYWADKYCRNELARGFEVERTEGPFTALTAFEVLEHLPNPCEWLQGQLQSFGGRSIIFSTLTYEGTAPPDPSWWYYAFETGQHISFYQRRTLRFIGEQLGLDYWNLRGLHVLSANTSKGSLLMRLLAHPRLSAYLSDPLSFYVKRRMTSLTFSDHEALTMRGLAIQESSRVKGGCQYDQ
ncbi:MAG: class I SAM-dependent methyltransferase [Nitrospiraceae bacterium]|jgi:hypothetical protein|nr:class I SAM-dependent methyltransferase [Nitrospiraceae bacterium]